MRREHHIIVSYNPLFCSYMQVGEEVRLATQQWPSVQHYVCHTSGNIRFISKWQDNVEACVEIFLHHVKRHPWWEEVE